MEFKCGYLGDIVELTAERERHIRARHGDSIPNVRALVQDLLAAPDMVAVHRVGPELGFIKWVDDDRTAAVVVVLTDVERVRDSGLRHWVVTAYTTENLRPWMPLWEPS